MTFYDCLRFFIIYAFFGWCIEVAYAALEKGAFVNRGFLNGPVCPIYGFGMLTVLLALTPLGDNLIVMFLGSVLLTSALEYATGYILEKVFNDKWWDYSDCRFNLKGYICLKFSLAWGVACVAALKLIHPAVRAGLNLMPRLLSVILLCVLYAVFITDVTLTVIEAAKIKKYFKNADSLEAHLRGISDSIGSEIAERVIKSEKLRDDLTERKDAAAASVREWLENSPRINELEEKYNRLKNSALSRHYTYKRLSKAFPAYFEQKSKKLGSVSEFLKIHAAKTAGENQEVASESKK